MVSAHETEWLFGNSPIHTPKSPLKRGLTLVNPLERGVPKGRGVLTRFTHSGEQIRKMGRCPIKAFGHDKK
jgi:hypothetical protein